MSEVNQDEKLRQQKVRQQVQKLNQTRLSKIKHELRYYPNNQSLYGNDKGDLFTFHKPFQLPDGNKTKLILVYHRCHSEKEVCQELARLFGAAK